MLVVVGTFDPGANESGAADNKGNSFVLRGAPVNYGSTSRVACYTCENGTGGSGHTFTFNASTTAYPYVFAFEILGANASSAIDVIQVGTDGNSPFVIASGTLAQANELLIAGLGTNSGNDPATCTPGAGWTLVQEGTDGINQWTGAVVYQIVSSVSSVSTAATQLGGVQANLFLISIKEGSAAAATSPPPLRAFPRSILMH